MIFSSGVFVLFFAIVFAVHWLILRGMRPRHWLLFLASLFFYGWWDWRFLALILFVIGVSYAGALAIERHPGQAGWALGLTCASMLAVLGVFKYFNFFAGNLAGLFAAAGFRLDRVTAEIILPAGISFYTFQAISYVADVYRGAIPAQRGYVTVGLYIAFFPQLVAGPIVRAADFIPQTARNVNFNSVDMAVGLKLFMIGFIYKSVFADNISPFVDMVFADVSRHDNGSLIWATIGFYSQIYFDFAGYSIMAIGIARMLGYRLARNFNFPYLALSITDFWRRWHLSLSTWLRDYLYIPLGGNRHGRLMRDRNILATMVLGGLWHGASWNFVLWGTVHGLGLVAHKALESTLGRAITALGRRAPWAPLAWTFAAWGLTQLFVLLCWVPFRARGFEDTLAVLSAFAGLRDDEGLTHASMPYLLLVLPVLADTLFVSEKIRLPRIEFRRPEWFYAAAGAILAILLTMVPLELKSFIYFQF